MPTSSTVVTVRQRIVTVLTAEAALSGVQITYGHPGEDKQARESIFTAFATVDHEIAVMRAGRKKTDEEYVQQLVIEVSKHGGTQEESDVRAWALQAVVESVFREDPNLGISDTIHWAKVIRAQDVGGTIDRGHATRIEVDIAVKARLI